MFCIKTAKIPALTIAAVILFPALVEADLADELDDLVGYTIVASKTIVRWYDNNDADEGSFNGCSHGRVIVFSDGTGLTCAEYGYQYAYRPTAVILAKEISIQGKSHYDLKMVVEDEIYDMRN